MTPMTQAHSATDVVTVLPASASAEQQQYGTASLEKDASGKSSSDVASRPPSFVAADVEQRKAENFWSSMTFKKQNPDPELYREAMRRFPEGKLDPVEEKKLMWKIHFLILPCLAVCVSLLSASDHCSVKGDR